MCLWLTSDTKKMEVFVDLMLDIDEGCLRKFAVFLRDGVHVTLLNTWTRDSNESEKSIGISNKGKRSMQQRNFKHAEQRECVCESHYIRFEILLRVPHGIHFEYIVRVKFSLFQSVISKWHSCIPIRCEWWMAVYTEKNLIIKMAAFPLCTHTHTVCVLSTTPSSNSNHPWCVHRTLTHKPISIEIEWILSSNEWH